MTQSRRRPSAALLAIALAAIGLVARIAAAAPRPVTAAARAGDPAWRQAAAWDDGAAELCAYEVTWPRYGHSFTGRALLVLVKEPWAPDLDVKADTPRPDGFDVLKLNHIRDVPTGVYTYHQMASVQFRRDDAALVKIAATSSEACGVSTAYLRGGELELRSYFDGLGDRTLPWPAGAVPQDALPALLRDWAGTTPLPEALEVFPSLLDSRLAVAEPRSLRPSRREIADLTVPGGTFPAVEVRLDGAGEWLVYRFRREAPHELLELATSDGTTYRMARCGRERYWEMHDPGGEAWLPPGVR
jgi:hypothetical protein